MITPYVYLSFLFAGIASVLGMGHYTGLGIGIGKGKEKNVRKHL